MKTRTVYVDKVPTLTREGNGTILGRAVYACPVCGSEARFSVGEIGPDTYANENFLVCNSASERHMIVVGKEEADE